MGGLAPLTRCWLARFRRVGPTCRSIRTWSGGTPSLGTDIPSAGYARWDRRTSGIRSVQASCATSPVRATCWTLTVPTARHVWSVQGSLAQPIGRASGDMRSFPTLYRPFAGKEESFRKYLPPNLKVLVYPELLLLTDNERKHLLWELQQQVSVMLAEQYREAVSSASGERRAACGRCRRPKWSCRCRWPRHL
jgi:hypothetical protein